MQRPSDEELVAFLDGELDEAGFAAIESCLNNDPETRRRLEALTSATLLVRESFDEVLREPIPARLIAACTVPQTQATVSASVTLLTFPNRIMQRAVQKKAYHAWWGSLAAAAVAVLVFGGSLGYVARGPVAEPDANKVAAQSTGWIDNIAGYHTLLISSTSGADNTVFDVPPGDEKALPVDILIPDLKPWRLSFKGARKIVSEGKPAYQFFYGTDDQSLGPITVTVTTTNRPEMQPTFERRDSVNLMYWRHGGHGYAIVGSANKGYMWNLLKDIAYQLKAI